MSTSNTSSLMSKNRMIVKNSVTNWILAFILFFPIVTFAQGVKVKWQDSSGREFSIVAPSGELGYSMLVGDKIAYNFSNQVSQVGGLKIQYNFSNQVTGTSGSVK